MNDLFTKYTNNIYMIMLYRYYILLNGRTFSLKYA